MGRSIVVARVLGMWVLGEIDGYKRGKGDKEQGESQNIEGSLVFLCSTPMGLKEKLHSLRADGHFREGTQL